MKGAEMAASRMVLTMVLYWVVALVCGLAGCGGDDDRCASGQCTQPGPVGKWMVASGHCLATEAGLAILRKGGNAFDAGVATCMALNVTRAFSAGMVGVAPILIYDAKTGKVRSYNGVGTAPAVGTSSYYRGKGWGVAPFFGVDAQLIPASPDAWIGILKEYGTKSLGEVAEATIRMAEEGHPLNKTAAMFMDMPAWQRTGIKLIWPYNYRVFYEPFEPEGPKVGEVLVQKDVARSLRLMVDAEQEELRRTGDRVKALEAARAVFYQGEIAQAIVKMQQEEGGGITLEDLAGYRGRWEAAVCGTFHDYTIWSNKTWCQGPTVPMILQILDGMDLKVLGHNSAEYISTVAQAIELAFADREAYFGDPDFVDVPINGLLSKEYAAQRRKLIDPQRAFGRMPPSGDPWTYEGRPRPDNVYMPAEPASIMPPPWVQRDTTYLCVVDSEGNAVSLTPSDFPWSPMVPGYGITLGTRMSQFHFQEGHPAQVAPGKRPRITPNPSMVTRGGELVMPFGTPGGDQQPQSMVQVFLNIMVWGMDPQAAIDAARFGSRNFPDSFSPHPYSPGRLEIQEAIADRTAALTAQGYKVAIVPDESAHEMGAVCAILKGPSGRLIGGADPREEAVAQGN
jgi:gamma-glutamyltranspeptidase/glutathione hydrolase